MDQSTEMIGGQVDRARGRGLRVAASLGRLGLRILPLTPAAAILSAGIARCWMDEDGFINLRVVRNLLHGAGPVFNLGERVEAVTSALWIAMLALIGVTGVPLEYVAVFGGIALMTMGVVFGQIGSRKLFVGSEPLSRHRSRAPTLPLGAAIFVALPPVWDYASSGLETGLGIGWLGASFALVARQVVAKAPPVSKLGRLAGVGAVVSAGPLVRPEFALYAMAMLAMLALWAVGKREGGLAASARDVGELLVGAIVLPLSAQAFRMGYFASVVPNPAIAKEAFSTHLSQGECYFRNFFGTYLLAWPLGAMVPFLVSLCVACIARREIAAMLLSLALPVAAALHVGYLVAIGGDYMHGRLLISPIFAALLPVMSVPLPRGRRDFTRMRALLFVFAAAVLTWVAICATSLRVGAENVCNIGDERGWYTRISHASNPIALGDFRGHFFYTSSETWKKRIEEQCPTVEEPPKAAEGPGCRRVYVDDSKLEISSPPPVSDLARDVDPRVAATAAVGAIGIIGYRLPSRVEIVDANGLSDPIVGRFALETRGRPGHEKTYSVAWMLARYAEPRPDDDAAVVAARHALHCGRLSSLVHAVTSPLTLAQFFDNFAHAAEYSRLRVPRDPFDAEAQFCGTAPDPEVVTGGSGGKAYRWRCPAGRSLSAVRGWFNRKENALARIQGLCAAAKADVAGGALEGPMFGEDADESFEVRCPADGSIVALQGASDSLVRSVGLLCSGPNGPVATSVGGADVAVGYSLACPAGRTIVGLRGRAGSLIDSVGVICASAGP
jgi:arabinofuranosyltransferase